MQPLNTQPPEEQQQSSHGIEQRPDRDQSGRFVQGRPPGPGRASGRGELRLTPLLIEELKRREGGNGPKRGRLLAKRIIDYALRGGRGDAAYANMILDRIDGRAPLTIQLDAGVRATVSHMVSFDYEKLAEYTRRMEQQPALPPGTQQVIEGNAVSHAARQIESTVRPAESESCE